MSLAGLFFDPDEIAAAYLLRDKVPSAQPRLNDVLRQIARPGRKTDMSDSQWLAVLARFGLVRGSFVPPQDLRGLHLLLRYRLGTRL